MGERVPVEVGQLRRDPDKRMFGRVVRVVEVGVCGVYEREAGVSALCEPRHGGLRTRIRLVRLEKWEVVQ